MKTHLVTLHKGEKAEIKKMLCRKLALRTKEFNEFGQQRFEDSFDPTLNVRGLISVHEAYQHLIEEYIQKGAFYQ